MVHSVYVSRISEVAFRFEVYTGTLPVDGAESRSALMEEPREETEESVKPVVKSGPRMLGAYRMIGRPLGAGGMASVYKVEDESGGLFAAKLLNPEFLKDRRKRERFMAEFEILESLHSRQIVRVHELVEEKSALAIIMEYVEGMSLKEWIRRHSPFPEAAILHILGEVSRALLEIHQSGYCHRDLKPENILISSEGEIKLLDFGVVRDLDFSRTLPGTVLGTVDYMAPEQINPQGRVVDARADLYALGVITWEMLTRRLPSPLKNSDSIVEIYEKKMKLSLRKGRTDSLVLEEFCAVLMMPDPQDRPEHVAEVLDFINDYMPIRKIQRQYRGWLTHIHNQEILKRNQTLQEGQIQLTPESSAWVQRFKWLTVFGLIQLAGFGLIYQFAPRFQSALRDGFTGINQKMLLNTKAESRKALSGEWIQPE